MFVYDIMLGYKKPLGKAVMGFKLPLGKARMGMKLPMLDGPMGKQVANAFLLGIETGMRKGEMLGLEWAQISGAVAWLPRTKNGDARAEAVEKKIVSGLERKIGRR